MHRGKHIDDMTKKWPTQTPSPPRIPTFYTLRKIHKPIPVGRLIISGCDGPTEGISSFVDKLLQPIANTQPSYIKDTNKGMEWSLRSICEHRAVRAFTFASTSSDQICLASGEHFKKYRRRAAST